MADITEILRNAKDQLNILLGNMFTFDDDDMANYDKCYSDVFRNGINFSYMSSTFYAQYAAEIMMAALSSNPFRKFIMAAIEAERTRTEPGEYWHPSMSELRLGLPGKDYTRDVSDIVGMMNVSYVKLTSLNEWYGTDDGKEEFEMYCLSGRAVRDIKAMVCELPYLIRHYDWDETFAKEIMEYAGIVAAQIRGIAEEKQ